VGSEDNVNPRNESRPECLGKVRPIGVVRRDRRPNEERGRRNSGVNKQSVGFRQCHVGAASLVRKKKKNSSGKDYGGYHGEKKRNEGAGRGFILDIALRKKKTIKKKGGDRNQEKRRNYERE